MSYEDRQLNPTMIVEPCEALFHRESSAMVLLLMTPCRNCGELRSKDDPSISRTGLCHLCNSSEELRTIRGNSTTAAKNLEFIEHLGMDDEEDDW